MWKNVFFPTPAGRLLRLSLWRKRPPGEQGPLIERPGVWTFSASASGSCAILNESSTAREVLPEHDFRRSNRRAPLPPADGQVRGQQRPLPLVRPDGLPARRRRRRVRLRRGREPGHPRSGHPRCAAAAAAGGLCPGRARRGPRPSPARAHTSANPPGARPVSAEAVDFFAGLSMNMSANVQVAVGEARCPPAARPPDRTGRAPLRFG